MTKTGRKLHSEERHNLYYSPDVREIKSKEDEMGEAHRMHVSYDMHTYFLSESLKGRDHKEDTRTDGRILKGILKKHGVKWIHFAKGKDQRQDLVIMIINLQVP